MLEKMLTEYGFILVPLVGGIVWLVRLEGRVNAGEARDKAQEIALQALQASHNDQQVRIAEQFGRINASLARIEERLSVRLET